MNAKKIMGAVLVALLAAALFVGAGAAAADYGTVFTYQNTSQAGVGSASGVLPDGVWNNGAAQITVVDHVVYPGANFVAGTYKLGEDKVYVTYPTATYPVNAEIGVSGNTVTYLVANGGNVYAGSDLTISVKPAAKNIAADYVLVTYPNGTVLNLTDDDIQGGVLTADEGTYKVQAIFNGSTFVEGVPANLLLDTVSALTFTVVGEDDATISGSVDTLYAGESLTVTVKGTPGTVYELNFKGFDPVNEDQFVKLNLETAGKYNFTMPNNGEATFQATVAANTKDEATVKLVNNTDADDEFDTVEFTVSPAVIDAKLGAASYYIGNTIVVSGTSTAGISDSAYDFYITGTNFKKTLLTDTFEKEGKTWEVKLPTADVNETGGAKKLDVGTYTITIEKVGSPNVVVKTVAVALKQPFISILEAPEVVVQETEAKFIVNAEATTAAVKAYVFGTNYFLEVAGDQIARDKDVKSKFTVKLTEENTSVTNMSTGQYFMVFQHPMYDGKFNIMVDEDIFYLNTEDNAVNTSATGPARVAGSTALFNVSDRQTANAAQALCDALDSQNIDDMYVKYSFFVVGEDESFSISEIPTQVVKGDKIVISGVDTANADETVVVEMISTAFAAVPKETVGSAAFIVVTTTVAKDGTWEVTLDTSDLNVDEYSLSVAIKDVTKKNVKVNVVEAADKPDTPDTPDVPDTPDTPDTPTEPETPGFGALAALAGLGAVAVLLLRRE